MTGPRTVRLGGVGLSDAVPRTVQRHGVMVNTRLKIWDTQWRTVREDWRTVRRSKFRKSTEKTAFWKLRQTTTADCPRSGPDCPTFKIKKPNLLKQVLDTAQRAAADVGDLAPDHCPRLSDPSRAELPVLGPASRTVREGGVYCPRP